MTIPVAADGDPKAPPTPGEVLVRSDCEALISELAEQTRRWRLRARLYYWLLAPFWLWLATGAAFRFAGRPLWPFGAQPSWWEWLIQLSGMFAPGISALATRRHRQVLQACRQICDTRAIGPLVEALDVRSNTVRADVGLILTGLLAHVQPGDEKHLDARQRKLLLDRCLTRPDVPPARREATLQALRAIADEQACRAVEAIAGGEAATRAEKRFRELAREALPDIRSRAAQVTLADRLLRLVEAPEDGTLLRPVQGGPSQGAGRLVRPVGGAADQCGAEGDRQ